MIHVVATIELQPGAREQWLKIFRENLAAVRAEDGCVAYGPTTDVDSGLPAQGGTRANTITILETWAGLDQLRAHLQAPHMRAYRERVASLVKDVKLQVLQPV